MVSRLLDEATTHGSASIHLEIFPLQSRTREMRALSATRTLPGGIFTLRAQLIGRSVNRSCGCNDSVCVCVLHRGVGTVDRAVENCGRSEVSESCHVEMGWITTDVPIGHG